MNTVKKIERSLTALALSPLIMLEKQERDRKLEERLKRFEEKRSR
jgi:hypothetical protein